MLPRVILCGHGIRLPVVNRPKQVQGIITTTDMVRSHITFPHKGWIRFKETLEQLYGIKQNLERRSSCRDSRPTQDKIYSWQITGRILRLERGLAEPAIVINKLVTVGY